MRISRSTTKTLWGSFREILGFRGPLPGTSHALDNFSQRRTTWSLSSAPYLTVNGLDVPKLVRPSRALGGRFHRILGHQGPLTTRDQWYRGSSYNVVLQTDHHNISFQPLRSAIARDPVTLAEYAREHNLLDQPGWRGLSSLAVLEGSASGSGKNARLDRFVDLFGNAVLWEQAEWWSQG